MVLEVSLAGPIYINTRADFGFLSKALPSSPDHYSLWEIPSGLLVNCNRDWTLNMTWGAQHEHYKEEATLLPFLLFFSWQHGPAGGIFSLMVAVVETLPKLDGCWEAGCGGLDRWFFEHSCWGEVYPIPWLPDCGSCVPFGGPLLLHRSGSCSWRPRESVQVGWEADGKMELNVLEIYWGKCLWRTKGEAAGVGRESFRPWWSSDI